MILNPLIIFRCDGSHEIGLGHVARCLALADMLRDNHGCRVLFAMRRGPVGIELVKQNGYKALISNEERIFNYATWLKDIAMRNDAQALVLDVRDDLPKSVIDELRELGVLIVTIDDTSERRLSADLSFYPPVPQVQRLDWSGFTGELYVGWKWVVLHKKYANRPKRKQKNKHSVILVTMGGSDPAGLTLTAIKALDLVNGEFKAVVVLGPAFCHHEALADLLANVRCFCQIHQNSENMPALMAQADLAVASFGVAAYELAAMGVPAIYLCLTEDHAESASSFVESDMAACLGVFTEITVEILSEKIKYLLNNKSQRTIMAKHATQRVDGQGALRIAQMISMSLGTMQR